jgi:hypothetical protein
VLKLKLEGGDVDVVQKKAIVGIRNYHNRTSYKYGHFKVMGTHSLPFA